MGGRFEEEGGGGEEQEEKDEDEEEKDHDLTIHCAICTCYIEEIKYLLKKERYFCRWQQQSVIKAQKWCADFLHNRPKCN